MVKTRKELVLEEVVMQLLFGHPEVTILHLLNLLGGGFGMTISELSTAVEYKINTITIVMNNKSWGAEKAYQKDLFGIRSKKLQ